MKNNAPVKLLAIIPARSGSKRIANKNIRNFLGKPLLAYTIGQAKKCGFIDRLIVDTDSDKIAAIAKQYGAEVPWLRPKHLAGGRSQIIDSILYLLARLKKQDAYIPTHVMILQTVSPLREVGDIVKCWELMRKSKATTVITVQPTHPLFFHLGPNRRLVLVNAPKITSTNTQDWEPGYTLNGSFVYIVKTNALWREKSVITKHTQAVVCPKWRSIDLDTPEEWVMAEVFYKNREYIKSRIRSLEQQSK